MREIRLMILIIGLLFLPIACEKNHSPIISEIHYQPNNTSAGTIYSISIDASDEDGDALQYSWSANGGEFLSTINTKEVDWRSPADGEGNTYTLIASVSDGEFHVSKELILSLTEPVLGGIIGTVNFLNTKIPVEGVKIAISGKEAYSDINGEYSLSGLVARKDTLKADKADFGPKEVEIVVPAEEILRFDFEMLSVINSSKVSGTILDQESLPVKNAEVILINPNWTESRIRAYTDANGNFRLLYVPHGERKIIVRKEIGEDYRYTELDRLIEFSEIEQKIDFVMEKITLRGILVDSRDGNEYPYKTIGSQTWMQTNLAYLPEVYPPSEISYTKPLYYVYGYNGTDTLEAKNLHNYLDYGVLYNWQSANKSCPLGWHLPDRTEWYTLVNELWPDPGNKMRTSSGWQNDSNARNSSGFSAMPAGKLEDVGKFSGSGNEANFYSSELYASTISWVSSLYSANPGVWVRTGTTRTGYSVRCIRNY